MPTHFEGSRAERRTLETFIKLTRCTNSVLGELSARQTTGDLTPSQFAVLEALYHIGSMTQGEVSSKVLKSTSNLTTVIDNLERDG
ncbi:MAG TPA: MarR family transcriptional regulator, partial [Anaerolineales bacterium]|nr:MarR family transcriptional regulator [Anaerolineales bacterium]